MAKLLLAEDGEFSRDMLARRLERSDYEVLAAADGREAVRAARIGRPDLIPMDLDMPVMDGRAAIRALKPIF
jgi:CheY-like chemotaxis protein